VESDDLIANVIPGRAERESQVRSCAPGNLEIPGSMLSHRPGMPACILTKAGRGLIAAAMNNAATIAIARRRRISAVWADVCV